MWKMTMVFGHPILYYILRKSDRSNDFRINASYPGNCTQFDIEYIPTCIYYIMCRMYYINKLDNQ